MFKTLGKLIAIVLVGLGILLPASMAILIPLGFFMS